MAVVRSEVREQLQWFCTEVLTSSTTDTSWVVKYGLPFSLLSQSLTNLYFSASSLPPSFPTSPPFVYFHFSLPICMTVLFLSFYICPVYLPLFSLLSIVLSFVESWLLSALTLVSPLVCGTIYKFGVKTFWHLNFYRKICGWTNKKKTKANKTCST